MTDESKCATCVRLEVWPNFGAQAGTRYLCEASLSGQKIDPFGKVVKYGWPCKKGIPKVKDCDQYSVGMHYSRRAKQ